MIKFIKFDFIYLKKFFFIFIIFFIFIFGCIFSYNYYFSSYNYKKKINIEEKIRFYEKKEKFKETNIFSFSNKYFKKIILEGKIKIIKDDLIVEEGYILFYKDYYQEKESIFIKGDKLLIENYKTSTILYGIKKVLILDYENNFFAELDKIIYDFKNKNIYFTDFIARFIEDFEIKGKELFFNFLSKKIFINDDSIITLYFNERFKEAKNKFSFLNFYKKIVFISNKAFIEFNNSFYINSEYNSKIVFDNNFISGQKMSFYIDNNKMNIRSENTKFDFFNEKYYIKIDSEIFDLFCKNSTYKIVVRNGNVDFIFNSKKNYYEKKKYIFIEFNPISLEVLKFKSD
ncbi:MAG: hypothetical protein N3A58_05020 [Spirochaetes bacterium]|nr:hypothetical protein [Spirochaetota bacterium]